MCEHLNKQNGAKQILPATTLDSSNMISKKDENKHQEQQVSSSNCSWRNPEDENLRRGTMLLLLRNMLFSNEAAIMKMMNDKTYQERNEYKATLLRKLELHLYQSASSLEDYANIGTLYKRIRTIALKAIESP